MSDFKSKLPDFKEFSSMAGKLFKDVKQSVCEIIDDYKKKRAEETTVDETKVAKTDKPEAKAATSQVKEKAEALAKEETKTTAVKAKKKESVKKEGADKPDTSE